jgi:hypothetical protein
LESDIKALESVWHGEDQHFARNRLMAKLDLLSEDVAKLGRQATRMPGSGIDHHAKRLLDNMPAKSVA